MPAASSPGPRSCPRPSPTTASATDGHRHRCRQPGPPTPAGVPSCRGGGGTDRAIRRTVVGCPADPGPVVTARPELPAGVGRRRGLLPGRRRGGERPGFREHAGQPSDDVRRHRGRRRAVRGQLRRRPPPAPRPSPGTPAATADRRASSRSTCGRPRGAVQCPADVVGEQVVVDLAEPSGRHRASRLVVLPCAAPTADSTSSAPARFPAVTAGHGRAAPAGPGPQVAETHGEPGPAAGAPALDRPLGDAEDPGRLGHRVAVHVDQDQRGPLLRGEFGERLRGPAAPVSWSSSGAAGSRAGWPNSSRCRRQRHRRMGLPAPDPVQAGVHDDPVQPGRHRRVAPEAGGGAVGREQGVLQGVGGLLAVTDGAQRHRPEPVAVPPDQRRRRRRRSPSTCARSSVASSRGSSAGAVGTAGSVRSAGPVGPSSSPTINPRS